MTRSDRSQSIRPDLAIPGSTDWVEVKVSGAPQAVMPWGAPLEDNVVVVRAGRLYNFIQMIPTNPTGANTLVMQLGGPYSDKASSTSNVQIITWPGVPGSTAQWSSQLLANAGQPEAKKAPVPNSLPQLTPFFELGLGNQQRSSSEELVSCIGALNALLKRGSFDVIDTVLRSVPLDRMSPELIVTFARVTFAVRRHLRAWGQFVLDARSALSQKGLNPAVVLKGLA